MNGISPTSRAWRAPRATAFAWWSISARVTGSVGGCPSITIPRLSPTRSIGMPASSRMRALRKSYAVSAAKRLPSSLNRWTSSTVVISDLSFGSLPHLGSAPSWSAGPPRDRVPPQSRCQAQPGRAYDKGLRTKAVLHLPACRGGRRPSLPSCWGRWPRLPFPACGGRWRCLPFPACRGRWPRRGAAGPDGGIEIPQSLQMPGHRLGIPAPDWPGECTDHPSLADVGDGSIHERHQRTRRLGLGPTDRPEHADRLV